MGETWVPSLGWEDALEKGKATHARILAWRIPWGCKESDTTERLSPSLSLSSGHELEPTLGDSEGQRSLVCCSPWGHDERDTAHQLNKA